MSLCDKIIKWLGGYTKNEYDGIKTAIEVLRAKEPVHFHVSKISRPIIEFKAQTVVASQEIEWMNEDYIKEELARTLGEELYKSNVISFEVDNSIYEVTTGSIVYTGRVKVVKEYSDD